MRCKQRQYHPHRGREQQQERENSKARIEAGPKGPCGLFGRDHWDIHQGMADRDSIKVTEAMHGYILQATAKTTKVTKEYRRERLQMLIGTNAHEAIGKMLPGKKGWVPYTKADLKYDLGTGVLELESSATTDPADQDEIDDAAMAASAFISADSRVEVPVAPTTEEEIANVDKASNRVMAQASLAAMADAIILDAHVKMAEDEQADTREHEICAAQVMHVWDNIAGGAPTAEPDKVPLNKHNPG